MEVSAAHRWNLRAERPSNSFEASAPLGVRMKMAPLGLDQD